MSRFVVVNSTRSGLVQRVTVGPHLILADEPIESGGTDAGPNPYELLLAALGTCTSMTVRLYAERKQWPLQRVRVRLAHSRVHKQDAAECENAKGMVDRIEREISFTGDLSQMQRQRLLEIANKCPVHRTLTSAIQIDTSMAGDDSSPAG
jgi:putative redox protein